MLSLTPEASDALTGRAQTPQRGRMPSLEPEDAVSVAPRRKEREELPANHLPSAMPGRPREEALCCVQRSRDCEVWPPKVKRPNR